jgi:hypothetical protein
MTTAFAWQRNCLEVYCITCDTQVLESGNRCPMCRTPVAVSRSVACQDSRKKKKLFSVLGASGAGKTVFLGVLLDMLGKGARGLRGIPNGSFSLAVQDQTIAALEQRRFPEKTPSECDRWNWIHCEAFPERREKQRLDIITPDVAGEVLAREVEQPGSSAMIRNLVTNSDAILLLIDSTSVRDNPRREDTFAVKLGNYIASRKSHELRDRPEEIRMPVAVVLTKTDICPEAEFDTEKFVQANLPGFQEFCKHRFRSCEFFPASVVGTTIQHFDDEAGNIGIPLHVQPRGIIDPLQWALGKMERKWRNLW